MSKDHKIVYGCEGIIEEKGVAGVYTLTFRQPAESILLDAGVHAIAVWNAGTAATLKMGDATDDDGIFTGVNLKATDLLADESISASGGTGLAGGKVGADIANSQWSRRYTAVARDIKAIVTTTGTAGSTGRTRVWITFMYPYAGNMNVATKVNS